MVTRELLRGQSQYLLSQERLEIKFCILRLSKYKGKTIRDGGDSTHST